MKEKSAVGIQNLFGRSIRKIRELVPVDMALHLISEIIRFLIILIIYISTDLIERKSPASLHKFAIRVRGIYVKVAFDVLRLLAATYERELRIIVRGTRKNGLIVRPTVLYFDD